MTRSVQHALIVLGMHRSGTSALAGTLGELGAGLPADLMAAADMNAKGFFESNKITYFNEELLASIGMTWFDPKRVPQAWFASPEAMGLQRKAVAILQEEFAGQDNSVLKDPRICRLLPFWLPAIEAAGIEPIFICVHRDPGEVAASLEHWANYHPDYGQYLWLRHVLDAEAESRGRTRLFTSYEQLMSDWRQVATRISETHDFALNFDAANVAGVEDFLSGSLRHFFGKAALEHEKQEAPVVFPAIPKVYEILERWADSGEDAQDFGTLDALRAELDRNEVTHIPLLETVLDQHRSHAASDEQMVVLRREAGQYVAQLTELRIHQRNMELQLEAREQALQKSLMRLARVRSHPFNSARDYVKFTMLKPLFAESSPLSAKMKRKIAKSAAKRDPNRSLRKIPAQTGLDTGGAAVSAPTAFPVHVGKSVSWHAGVQPTVQDRRNVLVVSHDASRTGAPILAHNMARVLSERYNVTVLCLRGGAIAASFAEVSTAVAVGVDFDHTAKAAGRMIEELTKERAFDFAVVNSIESRHVLPALDRAGTATVALLHEFASYTLPRTAFRDALQHAHEIVFSADVTLENALAVTHMERRDNIHILPQGKCIVPHDAKHGPDQAERDRLTAILRPSGSAKKRFLVLGAGYVQIRKGVDLFIEMARQVAAHPDGADAQFVWFGAGYAPDHDAHYSVYIQDQLDRAGLGDRLLILPETSEIEHVYGLADVFVLTSRLDPLPNVVIDSMLHGLPILCFDQASGIPSLLRDAGLAKDCIASYLDPHEMAGHLLDLMRAPELLEQTGRTTQEFAREIFDFDRYARAIESMALSALQRLARREEDAKVIAASRDFDPDFMLPAHISDRSADSAALLYLRNYARGGIQRRPEAGFHPGVYSNCVHPDAAPSGDAYADFLRAGRPEGPWYSPVIRNTDPVPSPAVTPAVGLHIHAYYTEGLSQVLDHLAPNALKPDLFVSVADAAGRDEAERILADYHGRVVAIEIVPNRGRDVGPFLTTFGRRLVDGYELIGHIHTKKSLALNDGELVERWTRFLFENLLGGQSGAAMLDRIAARFDQQPGLGIVYASDPYVMGWSQNEKVARALAARLGITDMPENFDFPIGNMFWIRSKALAPLIALGLHWEDYPVEPVAYDGTMLHALERLFGVMTVEFGHEVAVTQVKGVTR